MNGVLSFISTANHNLIGAAPCQNIRARENIVHRHHISFACIVKASASWRTCFMFGIISIIVFFATYGMYFCSWKNYLIWWSKSNSKAILPFAPPLVEHKLKMGLCHFDPFYPTKDFPMWVCTHSCCHEFSDLCLTLQNILGYLARPPPTSLAKVQPPPCEPAFPTAINSLPSLCTAFLSEEGMLAPSSSAVVKLFSC